MLQKNSRTSYKISKNKISLFFRQVRWRCHQACWTLLNRIHFQSQMPMLLGQSLLSLDPPRSVFKLVPIFWLAKIGFDIRFDDRVWNQFENLYKYYIKCCVGGSISCGLTHTLIVPLDLVKCRMQVDAAKYPSLGKGFKVSFKGHHNSSIIKLRRWPLPRVA